MGTGPREPSHLVRGSLRPDPWIPGGHAFELAGIGEQVKCGRSLVGVDTARLML